MDPRFKALYFVVDIILPLAVGYALRRRGAFNQQKLDRLVHLNIVSLVPVLNGLAFWGMSLALHLVWLPAIGVLMQIIPGSLALARVRGKYDHGPERGSFILATMLSNRGIIGTLTVFILFQQQGFAWARLVMLLNPIMFYLFCVPLAQYYAPPPENHDAQARPAVWRMFFTRNQVPLIGIAIGLSLNVGGLAQPAAIEPVFPWLVHVLAWMFLIPVGYAMRFERMRHYWLDMVELFGIKFLLTPLAMGALGWAVGLRGDLLATVVILGAAPTAVLAVVAGRLTRINIDLALAAFVLTTLVYLVVVFPLILLIFGYAL